MSKHVLVKEQAICETTFFIESIDATTRSAFRDIGCKACLLQELAASEQRTQILRDLIAKLEESPVEGGGAVIDVPDTRVEKRPRALCHECSEMVEIVDGMLAPHHGESGDGCPLNGAAVQICLHPLAADRIAWLETALVFDDHGGFR